MWCCTPRRVGNGSSWLRGLVWEPGCARSACCMHSLRAWPWVRALCCGVAPRANSQVVTDSEGTVYQTSKSHCHRSEATRWLSETVTAGMDSPWHLDIGMVRGVDKRANRALLRTCCAPWVRSVSPCVNAVHLGVCRSCVSRAGYPVHARLHPARPPPPPPAVWQCKRFTSHYVNRSSKKMVVWAYVAAVLGAGAIMMAVRTHWVLVSFSMITLGVFCFPFGLSHSTSVARADGLLTPSLEHVVGPGDFPEYRH
jgi:hypothetical protein